MLFAALALLLPQAPPQPVATTMLTPLPASDVHLDGYLGERVANNRTQWLDRVDLDARIEPFAHRPAQQPWAGEHLGKWLCAAAMAWQESGDEMLRARLDRGAAALLAAQEEDGYLGTYLPAQRFQLLPGADWDVWTIKYAMLGLLAYHDATGDARALTACRRAADLLLATFGDGRKSILGAGTHVGMAATSVLEPMARLYGKTAEPRYLAFARYLVRSWDEPGGPRLLTGLAAGRKAAQVANGKAYEMLSNLLGLCELYRVSGDGTLLEVVKTAWRDLLGHELLPTGSMSSHEHFTGGGRLPSMPDSNLAETCVTVTWMQLNLLLLQLTGDASYGREIERTAYNHLLAAQRPDGSAFCYYTPLRGSKPYSDAITCCSSSGARGLAMLGACSVLRGRDADGDVLVFDLLGGAHGEATLGGRRVGFALQSGLPGDGQLRLRFTGELPARFTVRLRLSEWAVPAKLSLGDDERTLTEAGFIDLPLRTWTADDVVGLRLCCRGRTVADAADPRELLAWGPCVLALDAGLVEHLDSDCFATGMVPVERRQGPELRFWAALRHADVAEQRTTMLPFADAGGGGDAYRVWLAPRRDLPPEPLVASTASRAGNVQGSIRDGDIDSFCVTFDGTAAANDWYGVAFAAPTVVRSITFVHGRCFHDGGWFDAQRGRPRVLGRASDKEEWQVLGQLDGYPPTTATDAAGLRPGQRFTLRLERAQRLLEVRVEGAPACGDNPRQAFSSCAELLLGR